VEIDRRVDGERILRQQGEGPQVDGPTGEIDARGGAGFDA
jgi:hypothetical protein